MLSKTVNAGAMKVAELCLTLCHPIVCPWNSPCKNTGVGCLPFPSPGDLPEPGIEPRSPAIQADSLPSELQEIPKCREWGWEKCRVVPVYLWGKGTARSGLPQWLSSKEFACYAGDVEGAAVLTPGLERSPGEGNGNLLQYSCLGNPMDRGAWQTAKEFNTT